MTTDTSSGSATFRPQTRLQALLIAMAAVLALVAAVLAGTLLANRPASAAPVTSTGVTAIPGGVSVLGTATVTGTPDTLTLSMSVAVTRPTAAEALAAANAAAAKLHASLKDRGVADKDIQTAGVGLYPNYTDKMAISGYQSTQGVTAKLRDMKTAGATIGAVATAAGDDARIEGIKLGLESDSELLKAARAKAVADARSRAQTYAKAADRSIGAVVSIAEPGVTFPNMGTQFQSRSAATAEAMQAVPIQPGSQDIQVSVTVTYALQ